MSPGKPVSAVDMFRQGHRRAGGVKDNVETFEPLDVSTSERHDVETSSGPVVDVAGRTSLAEKYRRVTVYLTPEQHQWARSTALQADRGLSISASDIIRLALRRLRDEMGDEELRDALVAQAWDEVQRFPGRAKRGLPQRLDD